MDIVKIAFGFLAWAATTALMLLVIAACIALIYLLGGSDLFRPLGYGLAATVICQVILCCYQASKATK